MAATICPRPVTLTFDLEVGVGVACDLGYPCAKFRLPRPFGFRVRADVRDIRQTDADDRLMPSPPLRGGGIIISDKLNAQEHLVNAQNQWLQLPSMTEWQCRSSFICCTRQFDAY